MSFQLAHCPDSYRDGVGGSSSCEDKDLLLAIGCNLSGNYCVKDFINLKKRHLCIFKTIYMKRIFILSVFSLILFSSCRQIFGKRIRGNGNIKTESRNTGSFSNVDVSGSIDVYVRQDSVSSVKVEADDNLMEYIEVKADGNTLNIRPKDNARLKPSKKIKVFVSNPSYKRFEASGACEIVSENSINNPDAISVDLSGACDVNIELKTPKVTAVLSGAGTITLRGQTKEFKVDGSGSTDVKCFELLSENTTVDISGAGDAQVFASVKLDVHVSGAADVKYKGNAAVTQSVSGAGSVKKVE